MDGLNKITQGVLITLAENQDLLKLLYYKEKDDNIFEMKDVDFEEVLGVNLFDYTYVPKVETKADIYVSITIDNLQKAVSRKGMTGKSETVKSLDVVVTIFSHYSTIKFFEGNRIMAIADKIEEIFASSKIEEIIGKFDFSVLKEITTIPEYCGYNLIFNVNTFTDLTRGR